MGQHNIIELNGKLYDSVTGVCLGKATGESVKHPVKSNAKVIDGFIRAPRSSSASQATLKPVGVIRTVTKPKTVAHGTGKKMDIQRGPAHHAKAHTPDRPKTLMRRSVHKPETKMKAAIKPQAPTEMAPPSIKAIAHPLEKKLSVRQVHPQRMARARAVAKSQHIRRYAEQQPALAARHTPAHRAAHTPVLPAIHARSFSDTLAPAAVRPASPIESENLQTHTDIFEAAIAHATSHQQKPHKVRKHRKLVNSLAGIAASVMIAGFVTYLNMPNIEVQLASGKAGFSAQLPGYKPNGYAKQGRVQGETGKVSISFRSGASQYTLTQRTSDWDSQTLLENYVTTAAKTYQTIESKGRTIYIFNDNNTASWVNGGVRYDLTGNAGLSKDDIVSLATSM